MQQSFGDAVPDEVKQGVLNSLWSVLTPEKRAQVALYAHLQRPFDAQAEETARVIAPQWSRLTRIQQARLYEAAHWDGLQRSLWEGMPAEMRQGAFEALWSYLDPKDRRRILAP